jgi:hypothetical protein
MPIAQLINRVTRPAWLRIAAAICWERTDETPLPYTSWTPEQKKDLISAMKRIMAGQTLGLPAAPPLSVAFAPNATAFTCLSRGTAWRYFIGHVAQSLVFELALPRSADRSWSLTRFSPTQLALLIDSRSLFKWMPYFQAYVIDPDVQGAATPGDPVRTARFLQAKAGPRDTPREILDCLLAWCRDNLVHYGGSGDVANLLDYWQYAGAPPVERMISGTVQSSQPQAGHRHWTKGCSGTTGFLRAVLRTANIPTEQLIRAAHALPHFVRERLYLSHGDDLYGGLSEATPPIPIQELPIARAKFDAWFGATVPAPDMSKNVGRRVLELAIQYLPNVLLHHHCYDLAHSLSHANSTVFTSDFQNSPYTLADLEAAQLWLRMDAKIVQLGGCASIPPVTYGT